MHEPKDPQTKYGNQEDMVSHRTNRDIKKPLTMCEVSWCKNSYTVTKIYLKNEKIIYLCKQHRESLGSCNNEST